MTNTTCQICGRAIKAKNGIIAHHGYRRPEGWNSQTDSCFGARYKPYEVSHSALDRAIPNAVEGLKQAIEALAKWKAEPPATLTYTRRDAYGRVRQEWTYDRPEGFDPATAYNPSTNTNYVGLWFNTLHQRERAIVGWTEELRFLRERLAAWKAPEIA